MITATQAREQKSGSGFSRVVIALLVVISCGAGLASNTSALNPQKSTWFMSIPETVGSPSTHNGIAINNQTAFILNDRKVIARDLQTGRVRWSVPGENKVLADDSRVFTLAKGRLVALEGRSGGVVWQLASKASSFWLVEDTIFTEQLEAVDRRTGQLRWQYRTHAGDAHIQSYLAVANGFVIAKTGEFEESLDAFRIRDGGSYDLARDASTGNLVAPSWAELLRPSDYHGPGFLRLLGVADSRYAYTTFSPKQSPESSLLLAISLARTDFRLKPLEVKNQTFRLSERPGCGWDQRSLNPAMLEISQTYVIFRVLDKCGSFLYLIPRSLEGEPRLLAEPTTPGIRQQVFGEAPGLATVKSHSDLVWHTLQGHEVVAVFAKPLRFERIGLDDAQVRSHQELAWPIPIPNEGRDAWIPNTPGAAQMGVWLRGSTLLIANRTTVSAFQVH